jgi:CheY-like chemotaxis protein
MAKQPSYPPSSEKTTMIRAETTKVDVPKGDAHKGDAHKGDGHKVKILIVDDHPVVREGLAMQIATQTDLEICGEAEDLPGAVAMLESCRPDVAIIDISLKDGNGIDLIRRIRSRHSPTTLPILVWSMYPENLYAERALRAGAQGYLHKGQATRWWTPSAPCWPARSTSAARWPISYCIGWSAATRWSVRRWIVCPTGSWKRLS